MRRRPDVTLTQLRYFVKAATYSSMTKAADELHIAQSAVSAAISQLEQQLGRVVPIATSRLQAIGDMHALASAEVVAHAPRRLS